MEGEPNIFPSLDRLSFTCLLGKLVDCDCSNFQNKISTMVKRQLLSTSTKTPNEPFEPKQPELFCEKRGP